MDFTDKIRLRGQAAEDLFFAELDRQLIKAMHEHQENNEDTLQSDQSVDVSTSSENIKE